MGEDTLRIEELDFIFSNKGSGVRKVLVVSALIESQITLLTEQLLYNHNLRSSNKLTKNFHVSIDFLIDNEILTPEEAKQIRSFRNNRDKAIHDIFKGLSRDEWNNLNKKVINEGKPIIQVLDKKLYSAFAKSN